MSKYQTGQQVCKPCLDLLVAEEDREGKTTLALSLIFQFARDIDPSYKGGEGWGRGEEGRVVVRQGLVWQRVIEPELRSAYLPYWSDCRVVNPGKASVTRELLLVCGDVTPQQDKKCDSTLQLSNTTPLRAITAISRT